MNVVVKCKACGLPELRYAICDRWDCPNLLLKEEPAAVCSGVEWGDWTICDADHFLATGELLVIGSMTHVECECRDAWALADPETVSWTATRRIRLPSIDMPAACSQCGKYPCECDDC